MEKIIPFQIYWNLHENCYSIRYKGIVILHATELFAHCATGKVYEKGRDKVRETHTKSVHAFIETPCISALIDQQTNFVSMREYKQNFANALANDASLSERIGYIDPSMVQAVERTQRGVIIYNPYTDNGFNFSKNPSATASRNPLRNDRVYGVYFTNYIGRCKKGTTYVKATRPRLKVATVLPANLAEPALEATLEENRKLRALLNTEVVWSTAEQLRNPQQANTVWHYTGTN